MESEPKTMYDPENILSVTNWTDEDLTVEWGKVPKTLKAHETKMYPEYLAEHFIKYLTDRELQRDGMTANDPIQRKVYEQKARGEVAVSDGSVGTVVEVPETKNEDPTPAAA